MLAVVVATLVVSAAAIPMSERVHCHVCGGVDAHLFPGPPPPACPPGPDLGLPRECPPNYKGCLTTYNGSALTRTCVERAYDPCTVANGVVYCYCSGRLCNSQDEATMWRLRCRLRHKVPEDDEDAEGSGAGEGGDPVDCLVTPTPGHGPATSTTPTAATTSAPTTSTSDDLDLGGSSQDSIEVAEEGNTTAAVPAETSGSGSGDARRTHSSAACVLAATLIALCVWRADWR